MQSKYRCRKGRTYRCVEAVASSLRIRLRTCRWSVMSFGHTAQPSTGCACHPVERCERELGEPVSVPVSSCLVPDFVAVPGIAKAAKCKYQVIDEGDLRDGPEE